MGIKLTTSNDNRSITLYGGQEDRRQYKGNTDTKSPTMFQADEAILTQLEAIERFTITGLTTGNRLTSKVGYSNDPHEAVAEWMVEFEEFVNGEQGIAHELDDDHRNTVVNGIIESLGWQWQEGAPFEARWDMTFIRGESIMEYSETTIDTVSPHSNPTIDGLDMGTIESMRCDKSQDIKPYPIAFADPGDNELLPNSGVRQRYTIVGQKYNDPDSLTDERSEFDKEIRQLVGQDEMVKFREPFPGREKYVMIDSYEGVKEAGVTSLGKFNMELIVGDNR